MDNFFNLQFVLFYLRFVCYTKMKKKKMIGSTDCCYDGRCVLISSSDLLNSIPIKKYFNGDDLVSNRLSFFSPMSLSKRKSPEHRRVFTNITDDEVSLKGTEELRLNLALVIPKTQRILIRCYE